MTTEQQEDAIGQTAYDAYCGDRDWKSFDGKPLPKWPDVRPDIKHAWIESAKAVELYVYSI